MKNADTRYEFKSVRTTRSSLARTTAKWQDEGWQLLRQRQVRLSRIEATFYRARPRRQRRRLAVLCGLLLIIIGVVAATTQVPAKVGQALGRIADPAAPPAGDRDRDGIPDETEEAGWSTQRGAVYRTDPNSRDSDGDGLTDGDEAGGEVPGRQGEGVYYGYSDPGLPDTDGDSLGDADEADLSLDPFGGDSDGDGLDDGREVDVVGSAPDAADTDGDGHSDGNEDANRKSQGLDPLWPDVKVSRRAYATGFAKGAVFGDLWREDSLAWMAGNLSSGAASSIPIVGTIVGPAADVRDVIGSAIRADWVGSGFSAVGAVPGGDAVAIPGKTAKFVTRNPGKAAETAKIVATAPRVPDKIKVRAAKGIWQSWDDLVDAGAKEKALLRLQTGRTNLDDLAAARNRPGHINGAPAKFFSDSKDGETYLEDLYGATAKGVDKQVLASTSACADGCNSMLRIFDVLADGVAHESKVGHVAWSQFTQNQIRKDGWLIKNGKIEGARWHFFASSYSNTLGANKKVYDLLDEEGIPYTIHLPARP